MELTTNLTEKIHELTVLCEQNKWEISLHTEVNLRDMIVITEDWDNDKITTLDCSAEKINKFLNERK